MSLAWLTSRSGTRFVRFGASVLAVLSASIALPACGGGNHSANTMVLNTASSDLGCDIEELTLVNDKPHEKVVEGCGRSGVYVKSCHQASPQSYQHSSAYYGSRDCKWLYAHAAESENADDDFVAAEDRVSTPETEVTTEGSTDNSAEREPTATETGDTSATGTAPTEEESAPPVTE